MMMLPDAPWQNKEGMARLLDVLGVGENATRFVGGCVRDTLLDAAVSDVDLATRLPPEEVIRRLKDSRIKAVPTGLAHGTVTAVVAGRPVEVTTLRRDVSTDGRRATIAFTDDWREDAARRDFTFNALSADPLSREVHDYFDGVADLESGVVRFIGAALQRIAEDHLRILRFFRFHARFGKGDPDTEALDACTARANDLMALSRERIADELLKILALPQPQATVGLMIDRHILRPVLPEVAPGGAARLARLVDAEGRLGLPADPLRRLAALLPADPAAAQEIAARLRLSNKASKRLISAAASDEPIPADVRVLAYHLGRDEAIDRLLLSGKEEPAPDRIGLLQDWQKPQFPLSGRDLIALGLKAGPEVSAALQAVERQWLALGFSDREEALALARREVDQRLRSSQ